MDGADEAERRFVALLVTVTVFGTPRRPTMDDCKGPLRDTAFAFSGSGGGEMGPGPSVGEFFPDDFTLTTPGLKRVAICAGTGFTTALFRYAFVAMDERIMLGDILERAYEVRLSPSV